MSLWQIFCPSSVGECVWARGPKDTFDWSAQDKSPCEVDINEGLVDGRVWRKQQRERGRHAVLDMKSECFMRHTDSWLDDSSLEPREKNHVCGGATYAWDWCSVHTPVAYKRIAIACKRNTLTLRLKEKISLTPTWCLWPWRRLPPRRRLPSRGRRAGWWVRVVPPPPRRWVDTLRAFIVPSEWLTWSLSNLLTGMKSCVRFARLLIWSFFHSFGFLIIFSLIHGAVRTRPVEHKDPSIFTSGALCRRSEKGVIFGRNLIQASDVGLWLSITRAIKVIYPIRICTPFSSPFLEERGCMVDSLPLIVPVARLVDGSFLMT